MSFKTWLESSAFPPGEEIIIGKWSVMSKLYPFIGEHRQDDELKTKDGKPFVIETNPDSIVMVNPQKRQFARGTMNCFVCRHRQPRPGQMDLCTEPFNGEQTHAITQPWLLATDIGGCVFVDCYPIFGKTQPVNAFKTSALYDRISDEKHYGAVFSLTSKGFRRIEAPDFDRPEE